MAQTKRKRRSKHRGTAAGTIEARGRTGRPLNAEEKKRQDRAQAREARLNRPPSWRSSINRALLAALFIFAIMVFTAKKNNLAVAVSFSLIALLIYIPLGYNLEMFLWKRRQRRGATPRS